MDTSEDILQQASPDLVRGSETARTAKAALPKPVTEDDNWCSARTIFFGEKRAPQNGVHAEE